MATLRKLWNVQFATVGQRANICSRGRSCSNTSMQPLAADCPRRCGAARHGTAASVAAAVAAFTAAAAAVYRRAWQP